MWLDAPESLLIDRTALRRNDASDADASVVRMQRAQDIGDIRWSRLDASDLPPLCCQPRSIGCASDSVTARLIRKKSSRRLLRAPDVDATAAWDMGSDTTNTRKQLPEPGVPPSRTLRQRHTPRDGDGSRRGIRGLARFTIRCCLTHISWRDRGTSSPRKSAGSDDAPGAGSAYRRSPASSTSASVDSIGGQQPSCVCGGTTHWLESCAAFNRAVDDPHHGRHDGAGRRWTDPRSTRGQPGRRVGVLEGSWT